LVNCEIRAKRESNSNGNKDSEIATDSETTCNSKLCYLCINKFKTALSYEN